MKGVFLCVGLAGNQIICMRRQHEYCSDSHGDVKWFIQIALIIYNQLSEFQRRSIFEVLKITYTHLSWLYFSYICNLQTLYDCFLSTLFFTSLHFQHGCHGNLRFSNVTVIIKMRVEMLCDYTSQKTVVSLRTLLCHCINRLWILCGNMSAVIVVVFKLIF